MSDDAREFPPPGPGPWAGTIPPSERQARDRDREAVAPVIPVGSEAREFHRCVECGSLDRGQPDWGLNHAQTCGGHVPRPAYWGQGTGHERVIPATDLRDAAELAVTALLELLPLEGSLTKGYHVSAMIQSSVVALPEEWGEAAYHIARLHRALLDEHTAKAPTACHWDKCPHGSECVHAQPAKAPAATCADCPVPWSEAHAEAVLAERERWEKGLAAFIESSRGAPWTQAAVAASLPAGYSAALDDLAAWLDGMTGAGE